MKKGIVVLLSLVLLLGMVLPAGADAVAQTAPCAPGEHKAYNKDIFTFVNDKNYPFYERDGFYYSYSTGYDVPPKIAATATVLIDMDGAITIGFYSTTPDYVTTSGGYGGRMQIKHNGRTIAEESKGIWQSLTISVKEGDSLEIVRYALAYGQCQVSISGSALTVAEEVEPTCTEGVVCELCGAVVKERLPHTYDDVLDADCNVCGEVREVTYTGWLSKNGAWYYYQNGVMLTNAWARDSVGWCYLGHNGAMATNSWAKDSVGWCFVGADGYCVTNQWVKDGAGWCYVGGDGRVLADAWVKDSVGWCYVGSDGYSVTNRWVKDSVGWCYLGADGRMLTNAWVKDSVGWCYVGSDGYCVTNGWMKDSVGWCYLNARGNVAKGAWVKTDGKWYFVDIYGYMVTGKQYIDGNWYYFDALTGALAE